MTREEAIELNKNLMEYMRITDRTSEYKFLDDNYIALEMGIKALEQEPILDKIRAEIESEPYVSKMEVLDIIDKYKAESEDNNG